MGFGHLSALDVLSDESVRLVEAFQRSRGLRITGTVDATTWARLVEAGWHLGDRLLYLATPRLRGDDVADLQVRLSQLGFDPGRIDGIFGPLLHTAVSEFQRNRALEPSGVVTLTTLVELRRVAAISADRYLVTDAREGAGFDEVGSGLVVIAGSSPLAECVAAAWADPSPMLRLTSDDPDVIASAANRADARLVLSFAPSPDVRGVRLNYWASYRSHSRRGERVASAIASRLASELTLPRVEVTGMALPILRETRMTTVHVEHGTEGDLTPLAQALLEAVAATLHK